MTTVRKIVFVTGLRQLCVMVLFVMPVAAVDSVAQSTFDHFTTGFRLEGAHRFANCESCHADGMFAGTARQCSGCHTRASRSNATSRPQTHITTSDRCDACHRANTWVGITRVDHLETLGTCDSCHDGRKAGSKPVTHLPASEQCDDCHRTTAWLPAFFEHSGILAACFSCHNGMTAMGKQANHIPATNICEDCHNTFSWTSVNRVDHMQVLGVCSGCHNGVVAIGKQPQHVPTPAECDSCHNTVAWR